MLQIRLRRLGAENLGDIGLRGTLRDNIAEGLGGYVGGLQSQEVLTDEAQEGIFIAIGES
jgi:hypothetical protein